MLVRIASDLHTEFWQYNNFARTLKTNLPPLDTDPETILVLAGDIGSFRNYNATLKRLFKTLSVRFRHIVMVCGNHEWYGCASWGVESRVWDDKILPQNVTFLEDSHVIIDDVAFIGSTLWTDFNGADEKAMLLARIRINDFRLIKAGRGAPRTDAYTFNSLPAVTPIQTVQRHLRSKEYLFDTCQKLQGMKQVVLTHHAPSPQSVHAKYAGDPLNAAFCSDLDSLILRYKPTLWVHGHMHASVDNYTGGTRKICNPLGYIRMRRKENKEYNPALVLTV